MNHSNSTCWTLIRGAAEGNSNDREHFARIYAPVIRSYLGARWRGTRYIRELDDALQEVFVDCFRDRGALARFERERPGGFRAFLYGITRFVALRIERAARRRDAKLEGGFEIDELKDEAPALSKIFDQAWARSLVREAAVLQKTRATDEVSKRRVELLRHRFQEGLPIREIAHKWNADPAWVHKEYVRARQEFRRALIEIVSLHHPGSPREVEEQCAELIDLLG